MSLVDGRARNIAAYLNPSTVAHYTAFTSLTACEQHIFDAHIPTGCDILDLGVGAGRTTQFLLPRAQRYLGIDYSETMIAACRSRFPATEFAVMDASDMKAIPSASFDVVIFSFNGLGCLIPDEAREQCHREVHRILRNAGVFIFSLQNSQSLLERPRRSGKGVVATAQGIVNSLTANARRIVSRLSTKTFWKGSGYISTNAHGGHMVFASTERAVCAALDLAGFSVSEMLNEDFPKASSRLFTRWIYYVCRKRAA